ncbi:MULTISPECIES: 30S ribosomal protein S17 [Thiomicrorhabdus]|uniref:Small ribosomal subunit protein uS17 n=1 Tax=Thiomicrorhabdus xiamenensis TaxID=2739063 RepID=A0A7D4P3U3_9GAMM|nr:MULTISPECIES: 30S ribosomal protein S17 [Thiomicrorhabdus]MBO1923971.1 30S ribosomal protein S17 [Thiomicrorhabdus sp. 6S3-12]QKI88435.1 30S ribosomal protein S17 [Thiomicrorhabdus xiamenensis]
MADQKKARTIQGVVESNGMQDSIVVRVNRFIKHPKYKKFVKKSTKIMAHDSENAASVGDTVTIKETAPISKNKSWTLVSIDEKAKI